MSSSFDRRKQERHNFPEILEIEYVTDPYETQKVLKGRVININDSGLCLIVSEPLFEGQEITIKSDLNTPSQTVTVHWIEKIDHGCYKIGFVFS